MYYCTTQICLHLMYSSHIVSKSKLEILDVFIIIGVSVWLIADISTRLLLSMLTSIEIFLGLGALKLWYISTKLYFLWKFPILVNSFKAQITLTLFVYLNLLYQMCTFLIQLITWVDLLYLIVIITLVLTCMIFASIARYNIKRFQSFLTYTIDMPSYIKIIDKELFW